MMARIPGFPGYHITDEGTVFSSLRSTTKKMSPFVGAKGYHRVRLTRGGRRHDFRVHTLVILAFKGPAPQGHHCRHLDGDKSNNSIANLAWGSPAENSADSKHHGVIVRGQNHPAAKLTNDEALAILMAKKNGMSSRFLADSYNVSVSTIDAIARGDRYADQTKNIQRRPKS